jgi:hypothetical protein
MGIPTILVEKRFASILVNVKFVVVLELLGVGNTKLRRILSLEFNDKFHVDGGRLLKLKNIDFSEEELVEVE